MPLKKKLLIKDDPAKVRREIVKNILAKISRGSTPTASEMKTLREFQSNEEAAPKVSEWVRSYEDLGEILGCHRASFPRWRRAYEDCPAPRQDGWHNVPAWRQWFEAHPEIHKATDLTLEMQRLALEEMKQKVRKAVHLNDIVEKQFTRNEIFAAQITKVVAEAKALLRQKFEHELPGYSARQEAAQVRILNKRAIDEVCVRLAELSKEWAA